MPSFAGGTKAYINRLSFPVPREQGCNLMRVVLLFVGAAIPFAALPISRFGSSGLLSSHMSVPLNSPIFLHSIDFIMSCLAFFPLGRRSFR